MKILIDHSAPSNLGDLAMLEGVIQQILRTSNGANLYVKDSQLPSDLWNLVNVRRVSFEVPDPIEIPDPIYYLRRIRENRYVRRYIDEHPERWRRCCHAMIGRVINPNKLEVENDRSSDTLGEWVSAYDMLHVVGGADLNDIFPQECWERCCLIQTFASQGKPVILTGQQIGPFYSSVTRHSLLRALREVKFIGLRESGESLQICKQARIVPDRLAVMGDDSFGLPAADGEEINSLLGQYGLSPGNFIAANLRIGSYIPGTMKYIQVVADCLSYISRRYDLPVIIVPISLDEGDSDVSSGYRLCEVVNEDWIHILDRGNLTARVVKGILGQAYAAVGVSYHLCTFALSQGVPAVALFEGDYYAQKARGLSGFWEEERIAMPLDRLNSREAIREVTDLIEDNAFRERLHIRAERAKRRWKEIVDLKVAEMLSRFSTSSPACLTSY